MDLPVLSYVMAAAEKSLRQIQQPSDCMREAYRLFTSIDEMYKAGTSREEDEAARSGPQAGPHEKIVDDDGDDE